MTETLFTDGSLGAKSEKEWMQIKGEREGVPKDLWRVYGKLYDLGSWIEHHPGGKEWIEETRGTDITENFAASHIRSVHVIEMLRGYESGESTIRVAQPTYWSRKSPDIFLEALKGYALRKTGGKTGPTLQMRMVETIIISLTLYFFISVLLRGEILFAVLAGWMFSALRGIGHNRIHQRPSRLVRVMDLTWGSSHYRTKHCISHHMYPNTFIDLEIERRLTTRDNGAIVRWFSENCYYIWGTWSHFLREIWKNDRKDYMVDCVLSELFLLVHFQGFSWGILLFGVLHYMATLHSYVVGNLTHHVSSKWIQSNGSFFFNDLYEKNSRTAWSRHQIYSARDFCVPPLSERLGRLETFCYILFSFLFFNGFNHHILHHLLPTLDASRLWDIRTGFAKYCEIYGMDAEPVSMWELLSRRKSFGHKALYGFRVG